MQDLNGVFVFNVTEREFLDRPTARLIKEFDVIEGKFWALLCWIFHIEDENDTPS